MTFDGEIRLSGWACTLATRNPARSPVPRRTSIHPSCLRLGKLLPRLSRGSWARNTINSLANPREWRRRKIFTPRTRSSHTFYRKPLPYQPVPTLFGCLAQLSLPKRFLSFLFGSARTRLFAGQRYLHKSAMQSLFIFCESMAQVYTTACMYVNIRVCNSSASTAFSYGLLNASLPRMFLKRADALMYASLFLANKRVCEISLLFFITMGTYCFWKGEERRI